MAKRFSLEFKQQAIDYALVNLHKPLASIAVKFAVGYSTLDKWIRTANRGGSSKRQLTSEQQQILDLEKEVKEASSILKNACVLPHRSRQEKYTVIKDFAIKQVKVTMLCKQVGVSTSGFYAWKKRQVRIAKHYSDLKAVYWQHHARLGAPSLVHDMHDLGYSMSERTIGRILKKLELRSKITRKHKLTTNSNDSLPTTPNLLDRQSTVTEPNNVWTTDITYMRTKKTGYIYA